MGSMRSHISLVRYLLFEIETQKVVSARNNHVYHYFALTHDSDWINLCHMTESAKLYLLSEKAVSTSQSIQQPVLPPK